MTAPTNDITYVRPAVIDVQKNGMQNLVSPAATFTGLAALDDHARLVGVPHAPVLVPVLQVDPLQHGVRLVLAVDAGPAAHELVAWVLEVARPLDDLPQGVQHDHAALE